MYINDTIAAIATPPGVGSIAVVRISGEKAAEVAALVFRPANKNKALTELNGYTALFGDFYYREQLLDEGVALYFKSPLSYTGENVVELSCHGGERVSKNLLHACFEAGARPAKAGEFTRRAVLNGKMTLTQAEAVMDIINAESENSLTVAGNALKGKISDSIAKYKNKLVSLAGHLAAYVDFPEEDVDTLTEEEFVKQAAYVKEKLDKLINDYQKGEIIRRGIKTAIVGSPNVGKSTLFNLLSGFERAIVTGIAGTTRDIIREQIEIAGVVLNISDTAGIRSTADEIEAEGIRRSYSELEEADLIIAVFDGSSLFTKNEMELAEECKNKKSLGIINKSDLGNVWNIEKIKPYFTEVIVVSAKEENTRNEIENAIMRIISLGHIDADTVLLANGRQLFAAIKARDALMEGINAINNGNTLDIAGVCLDEALMALAELTGESVSETVIDEVFSSFCVGK